VGDTVWKNLGTHSLSDVTETSDDGDLASKHDIGGTLDTVDERLAASVVVIELGLGHGVIDIDRGDLELALTEGLVEVVDTGGGLLRDTVDACRSMSDMSARMNRNHSPERYWGYFSWTMLVRSPPSSRIMLRGLPSLKPVMVCSMHHWYSSSVSPFQAKTGTPVAAMAAAAWSWVEKMF